MNAAFFSFLSIRETELFLHLSQISNYVFFSSPNEIHLRWNH